MTDPPVTGPEATGQASPEPAAGDSMTVTGQLARARQLAAAVLLAAALVLWAALPTAGARPGIRPLLVVAVICAVASLIRLGLGDARIGADPFAPFPVRVAAQVAELARTLPWPEAMIVAVLAVEALHRSRPWHTGLLAAGLLAYLFTAHLAETGTRAAALRPQLPVLAAGLGLLVLAVGAAALPRPGAGPAAELLRVLAVLAAIGAGALALPIRPRGSSRHR